MEICNVIEEYWTRLHVGIEEHTCIDGRNIAVLGGACRVLGRVACITPAVQNFIIERGPAC